MRLYFLRKLEEIKKKKSYDDAKATLIMHENDDEFGRVEVWSTNSEDKEVRRPTHGRSFVAKGDDSQSSGRCFMVKNEDSELRGYAIEGGRVSDSCFAMKPVPE